jgi:hypothetical protein
MSRGGEYDLGEWKTLNQVINLEGSERVTCKREKYTNNHEKTKLATPYSFATTLEGEPLISHL